MDLSLKDKRAFVSGASQGIGRAIAFELATAGAELCIVARTEEKLQATLRDLPRPYGQQHRTLAADLSDLAGLRKQLAGISNYHILVNNSGGPPPGTAKDAKLEEYLEAFTQQLLSAQLLVQALSPFMAECGYGRIVNIISTSVKQPIAGLGVSNTVRGAVANWAKTLATELAPHGITVNNVLPGATQTARMDDIFRRKAEKMGVKLESVLDAERAKIPAGYFAEASDVANAVAFLVSPAARYITGINLPVDGGRTLCL